MTDPLCPILQTSDGRTWLWDAATGRVVLLEHAEQAAPNAELMPVWARGA